MKKIITSTLAAAMLLTQLFSVSTYAEPENLFEATIGDSTYTISDTKVLSIDYAGTTESLTDINSLFTYGEFNTVSFSENVTAIPAGALEGCDKITNVIIPDTVTAIGDKAFAGTKITDIELSEAVLTVGTEAFLNCSDLTAMTVNSALTEFKDHAAGFNYDEEKKEYTVNDKFSMKLLEDSKAKEYATTNNIAYTTFSNEKIEMEIEYDLDEGTASEEMPTIHIAGQETILPEPTKEGYAFYHWLIDTNGDGNVDTQAESIPAQVSYEGKIKVQAVWAKLYNITYVLNGGNEDFDGVTTYSAASGETVLKDAVRDGYAFIGWYIDEDGDTIGDTKIETIAPDMEEDLTLYAMWEIAYKIEYELNGGTNYEGAPTQYAKSFEPIVLGTPTKANSTFEGWYLINETGEKSTEKITVIDTSLEKDIKLAAEWKTSFTITYVLNGGTNNPDNPTSYTADSETITLRMPTQSGKRFYKWYSDSAYTNVITEIPKGSTGDLTLYATWLNNSTGSLGGAKYKVTYNSNGGSSVSTQTVLINGLATKPKDPTKDGYDFVGWYTDSNLKEEYDFDTKVTNSFTLYAKWEEADEDNNDKEDNNTEYDNIIILTINSKIADLNGKSIENDVAPIIVNDRTMMPIRFIAETLGAKVTWNEPRRTVTIKDGSRNIVIHIDSDIAYIDGEVNTLDSAAFIRNDRTYIPVRFVAEALDCDVDWTEGSKTVTIKK